jgi:signal transduction histidine kinase
MSVVPDFLIPHNESARLKKLYDYQILDTHSEDTFDKIAMLASQIFETPFAFVNFVDEDRVFLKANYSSFQGNFASREKNPCALAILTDDFTVFNDILNEPYLKDSLVATSTDGIRFYAAAPLKTPEGFLIGTLCVADTRPRESVNERDLQMLKALSEVVINKLESRLRYKNLLRSQNELMNITLHEIKNPLASIRLANDVLRKDPERITPMSNMIKESVNRIQSKLHDLLKHSEMEEEQLKLNIEETDLRELLDVLIKNFELQAGRKRQLILLEYDSSLPPIHIDKAKISDVFHNLLSNALKYSYYDSVITIVVRQENSMVVVEFRDNGQGLDKYDMDKLFMKFVKLSSRPTGKETSNGLGLSICKSLIEMHNGEIYATSEGKDKGTTFYIKLPLLKKTELMGN